MSRPTAFFNFSDKENSDEEQGHHDRDRHHHRSRFPVCCAWMLLALVSFSLSALLLGLLFVSSLRSALPEVSVVKVELPKLDVDNRTSDTFLSANVETQIEFVNDNDDVEIQFFPLKVNVLSEEIQLGEITVPGFTQSAKNRTVLKVNTSVGRSAVNDDDARALKNNKAYRQIVLNTFMSGTIGFHYGIVKINWVPVLIACQEIRQADIDSKYKPKCKVNIFRAS